VSSEQGGRAKMSIVSRCGEIAKTSSRYLTFD